MSDSTSHLTDRFHFLSLPQTGFSRLAPATFFDLLGDVGTDAAVTLEDPVLIKDRYARGAQHADFTVGSSEAVGEIAKVLACGQDGEVFLPQGFFILKGPVKDFIALAAQQIAVVKAGNRLVPVRDIAKPQVCVLLPKPVGGRFGKIAKAALALILGRR